MWTPTTWRGEGAFESTAGGWRAIVSVERSRLIHFGPANSAENLLYAPARRDDEFGWGGHRVWLGPQSTWTVPWPPPAVWEKQAATSAHPVNERLELAVPSAGAGWPAFTRVYRWDGDRLVCGVELASGGARELQVVQIFQMPKPAQVVASLVARPHWPAGYVGLPTGRRTAVTTLDSPPPHAVIEGASMQLTHRGTAEKLGFVPQALRGELNGRVLLVEKGHFTGSPAGEPDAGFLTQVYLGSRDPFVELEQLSPLCRAGETAIFEVVIEGK